MSVEALWESGDLVPIALSVVLVGCLIALVGMGVHERRNKDEGDNKKRG